MCADGRQRDPVWRGNRRVGVGSRSDGYPRVARCGGCDRRSLGRNRTKSIVGRGGWLALKSCGSFVALDGRRPQWLGCPVIRLALRWWNAHQVSTGVAVALSQVVVKLSRVIVTWCGTGHPVIVPGCDWRLRASRCESCQVGTHVRFLVAVRQNPLRLGGRRVCWLGLRGRRAEARLRSSSRRTVRRLQRLSVYGFALVRARGKARVQRRISTRRWRCTSSPTGACRRRCATRR